MLRSELVHFTRKEEAYKKKYAAGPKNTTYTVGFSGPAVKGVPDIQWDKVVFVKETKEMWTHGDVYCNIRWFDDLWRALEATNDKIDKLHSDIPLGSIVIFVAEGDPIEENKEGVTYRLDSIHPYEGDTENPKRGDLVFRSVEDDLWLYITKGVTEEYVKLMPVPFGYSKETIKEWLKIDFENLESRIAIIEEKVKDADKFLRYDGTKTREEALAITDTPSTVYFTTNANAIVFNGREYGYVEDKDIEGDFELDPITGILSAVGNIRFTDMLSEEGGRLYSNTDENVYIWRDGHLYCGDEKEEYTKSVVLPKSEYEQSTPEDGVLYLIIDNGAITEIFFGAIPISLANKA